MNPTPDEAALKALATDIRTEAERLGFSQIAISDVDLGAAEAGLQRWLDAGFHGEMGYMARHGSIRARPAELVPGTLRVITARMDYLPAHSSSTSATEPLTASPPEPPTADWRDAEWARIADPQAAVVSVYARGRDYHKVLRSRLQKLAGFIASRTDPGVVRVFTDSAPVLEVALAARGGMGWRGKHTLLLNREAGSMFFLGELFIGLPLPVDAPQQEHCGSCSRCIDICPTRAIVAPYTLDARRCIAYLTIELAGSIPEDMRPLMGNRVYGCDDCQLVCPWNKYAQTSPLPDFAPRHALDSSGLLQLWAWSETDFLQRTEGSAMRRIGFERFRRNLAVALGNARRSLPAGQVSQQVIETALRAGLTAATPLVAEHIRWALTQSPGTTGSDLSGSLHQAQEHGQ
ncbi:MAG: tRNA epoxyqueuosine(34) reductase QueG [Burkholderiales bacterium]|nr:tRNA epoxyqueuosine(34) reductase QueG [Burkholderiales bacterium]